MAFKKETALLFLVLSMPAFADTVGHWRFDSDGAEINSPITAAENVSNAGTHDAELLAGNPVYSSDVPSKQIYDPITDEVLENGFSLSAKDPNSKLRVASSEDFNTSFTVELFIKIIDEPNGWHSFVRRLEGQDLRWQIDMDNSANGLYNGRARSRWDTPAEGVSDNKAEKDVDENTNFVVSPQGGNNAPKVFIDTGAKDEAGADVGPQNTGNPIDYIFDAASANPNEQKVSLQGDSINDDDRWHHVAVTFDQDSGEISFFFDYALAHKRTLSDSAENGYTHPDAPIDFGKLVNKEYGLLMDEIRFSNDILSPNDFLRTIGDEVNPATIAHWRMDGIGAQDEGTISLIRNEVSPLLPATRIA
ncbi:MAG: LamG domain-containing protein, partial [Verrucomicrobiales bacterium]|nr:LamG domain-containing protein [Verrucomicrobiales bacterium]